KRRRGRPRSGQSAMRAAFRGRRERRSGRAKGGTMSLDLGRIEYAPILLVELVTTALFAAAMALFVLRLKRGHARLRATLETQLAELTKTEEALRKSEVFHHSLVESLPQTILRKDLEGRFTFGNQNFCNELGRSLDEIRGKTDFDFFPAELATKY